MENFVWLLELLAESGSSVLVFVISFMGLVVAALALFVVLESIRSSSKGRGN